MKAKHVSLKKRMVRIWAYVFIVIVLASIFYGIYIFKRSIQDYLNSINDTDKFFSYSISKDVDDILQTTNSIYQNNYVFKKLSEQSLDEFDYISSMNELNEYLSVKTQAINYPAGMFFYDAKKDSMRSSYGQTMNILNKYEIDESLRKGIITENKFKSISYIYVADKCYLTYSLRHKNGYIGFVFDLEGYWSNTDVKASYYWNEEKLISGASNIDIDFLKALEENTGKFYKRRDYVYKAQITDIPIQIVFENDIDTFGKIFLKPEILFVVVLIPAVLIILIGYVLYIFNQTLLYPVDSLLNHVKKLEEGQKQVQERADKRTYVDEYIQLDEKIDELVDKISDLKNQKYEEEQKTNWARLQYYKLQINPHFYLNCLNTISMLIERNNHIAAQGMIKDLSSHFRYVFQDQRQFVSLGDELDEVRALCNIYSLRAGMPILFTEEVEDRFRNIQIPPLTLQTFVENSIKHRDDSGKVLRINVKHEQLSDRTIIYVSDNGNGFSKEDLEEYNKPVEQFEYKSNQVGIDNFKYRMKLLYDKKASFAFYNNDEGGAVSEITIWEVFG